jgi:NTE family protein
MDMTRSPARAARLPLVPPVCDRIALVLQGGGALGAYQGGVYEALDEAGIRPGWVSGVSIGAINAALIAGNPPERRLPALRTFWERVTDNRVLPLSPDGDVFRKARNVMSAWMTMTLGQSGFFTPRVVNPWFNFPGAEGATSFYDSGALRQTLEELVDFDLINGQGGMRFSVGAVNVQSGNFRFFHNDPAADDRVTIGLDHVMASGALPPALPMVRIGTDYYWDGGLVSNTPLQYLLDQDDTLDSLVFQVDLFSARGAIPRDMPGVLQRQKDIVYSSRTRANTDAYKLKVALKREIYAALGKVPEDRLTPPERQRRDALAQLPGITIIQLIYQLKSYEGEAKDYEFSKSSMMEHWRSGYDDTAASLAQKGWLDLPAKGEAIVTHDIHRERE